MFSRVTPAVANVKAASNGRTKRWRKGINYSGGKMSFHTRRENRVRNHTIKGLALVAGAFLVAVALSASANASTLRRGSTGGSASVTGALPGQVLWTYYETTEPFTSCNTTSADSDGCNVGGNGDNIIRLINPNGAANPALQGAAAQPVCAMIYVFDDDEEMTACCGCVVTSAGLATFSVEANLTSNIVSGGEGAVDSKANGAIAIVAASLNPAILTFGSPSNGKFCSVTQSGACNFGCDPTNHPGYSTTTANNLLGSITHNQAVAVNGGGSVSGLTEVGLFDDAGGDPTNLTYLQNQCGALVGNGTGAGQCNCPVE